MAKDYMTKEERSAYNKEYNKNNIRKKGMTKEERSAYNKQYNETKRGGPSRCNQTLRKTISDRNVQVTLMPYISSDNTKKINTLFFDFNAMDIPYRELFNSNSYQSVNAANGIELFFKNLKKKIEKKYNDGVMIVFGYPISFTSWSKVSSKCYINLTVYIDPLDYEPKLFAKNNLPDFYYYVTDVCSMIEEAVNEKKCEKPVITPDM